VKLALLGCGGHSSSIISALIMQKHNIDEVFVYGESPPANRFCDEINWTFCGHPSDFLKDQTGADYVFVAIGDNNIRGEILSRLEPRGPRLITIIHPTASVCSTTMLEQGVFVASGAILNSFVVCGQGAIINTGSIVEHGSRLGFCSHVAPGSVLCGEVVIGDYSLIGARSVVVPQRRIGSHVTVGAGGLVLENVEDNHTVVGSPARYINRWKDGE